MLADLLRAVRSARDVAPVFTHLGYELVPPGSTGQDVVAQWRGFRVTAADDPAPRERAREIARRFARQADRALAVAVGGGEMALAAPRFGGGPCPVLTVPLTGASSVALQQLEALRPRPATNALAHALRVADVLASEPASKRFFTAFRVILDRMAGSLDGRVNVADRRMAALLALTRVLFLYFVQAKGWLDGRSDYLPTLLDHALVGRRHFHRGLLHPLFFGTLNRPLAARSSRLALGRIPYLNGGLFEPHPMERRIGPVTFPNALWRDAFDTLFERFHFCVREAGDVDAIAPDMLGHVFERVMDTDERHATGTFYTPDSVVREVVEATIDAALHGATSRDALRRLRILDPAVGSGAFLLGALARLTTLRALAEPVGDAGALRAVRLDVLRHNLFGVDVSPVAVRLAELRLWLAVVADDPTDDIDAVAPLPNLGGVVRQGDTLLDPAGVVRAYDLAPAAPPRDTVMTVSRARARLFSARGPARIDAAKTLRRAEQALARVVLTAAEASATAALHDLAASARSRDLFGQRIGFDHQQQRRWDGLLQLRRTLRRFKARLSDDQVPFFSFDIHTPDVLADGGFSAVIGNPPWVRAERLTPAERRGLTTRFSWWRPGAGPGYAHMPDLAVAFLQRSFELVRPGGAVGLLLPSKIATATYGETARRHLVRESEIACVHRVPDQEAQRFGATTYPLALVTRKVEPEPGHRVRLGFDSSRTVAQEHWRDTGPWIFVPNRARDALQTFRASGLALASIAPPGLGVKTGADDVFVGVVVERGEAESAVRFGADIVTVENALLRPAVRGRDVRAFRAVPSRVMLWCYDGGRIKPRLPRHAAAYFAVHAGRLAKRSDHRDGPPWTLFRVANASSAHRVVWADIARTPAAVCLDELAPGAVPLNTCYVSALSDRAAALALVTVLNSTWTRALAWATADEARGGYRRMNARVIGLVPVPRTGPPRDDLVALATTAHHTDHVRQDDIDEAVAAALELPAATCRALAQLVATRPAAPSHRR